MLSSVRPHQCLLVADLGPSQGLDGQHVHVCERLGRALTSPGHFLSYKREITVVLAGALKELMHANT